MMLYTKREAEPEDIEYELLHQRMGKRGEECLTRGELF